jgi:hypothetical protein
MGFRETGYGDSKWMELAQDHIHWYVFVFVLMKLWVLFLHTASLETEVYHSPGK